MQISVAERSKASVDGNSLAEVAGSNPTWSTEVCLFCVVCVVKQRSLRRADPSSRGVLPTVESHCV